MHVLLHVTTGNQAGEKISVRHGQKVSIGRVGLNDFAIPDDAAMSREHFSVEFIGTECHLRNLSKRNVTSINGRQVPGQSRIQDGDEILAGQTYFTVSIDGTPDIGEIPYAHSASTALDSQVSPETPIVADASAVAAAIVVSSATDESSATVEPATPVEPTPPVMPVANVASDPASQSVDHEPNFSEPEQDVPLDVFKEALLAHFRDLPHPLFAILDAARDSMVLATLIQSENEYESLYEGTPGEALAEVAPYLVKLPSDSRLLKKLIALGWGESWGVYLTSQQPFEEIREHLRKFIMVQTDEGQEVYFRFYDPRVLRVFLPTCIPEEAKQFFGPVSSFYMEDDKPAVMLRIPASRKGAKEVVQLNVELDLQGTVSTKSR